MEHLATSQHAAEKDAEHMEGQNVLEEDAMSLEVKEFQKGCHGDSGIS